MKRPVFVVGCPRSGTTLLYSMLLAAGGFTVYRKETYFYDVLPTPDGRVILALGDVAGKGSPAALLMALLLAVLRTLVDEALAPPALVRRLNTQICRHSPASRFITFFYAVYDPGTGILTYVNAGQNPPLVRRGDGSYEKLGATGVALGMFEESTFGAVETRVAPALSKRGDNHMKEVKLQVKGMSCSGCEQRIQKVLARIEGVVRSAADHQAEEVRVVFDPNRTSEEALRLSIEQAGYEVSR